MSIMASTVPIVPVPSCQLSRWRPYANRVTLGREAAIVFNSTWCLALRLAMISYARRILSAHLPTDLYSNVVWAAIRPRKTFAAFLLVNHIEDPAWKVLYILTISWINADLLPLFAKLGKFVTLKPTVHSDRSRTWKYEFQHKKLLVFCLQTRLSWFWK